MESASCKLTPRGVSLQLAITVYCAIRRYLQRNRRLASVAHNKRETMSQLSQQTIAGKILLAVCVAALSYSLLIAEGFAEILIEGRTMGPIEYQVQIDPLPDGLDQQEVGNSIQAELDQVNQLMSTYLPDSDVSRFNASSDTDWIKVTADTAKVIERALEISKKTGGAFDITVGPLVDLWHFGPDKDGAKNLPSQQAIGNAQKLVGYEQLTVRLDPPALKKAIGGIRIDLSAIAKGYAVDRVATHLDSLQIENYFVTVGGEVRTRGTKSDGSLWEIGIERPDPNKFGTWDSMVPQSTGALASSGDYRNFFVVDGVTYSHTIDPETGKPVTHNLASASVLADDCMTADAYATAALVLGKDKAAALLDELDMQYHLITRDGTKLSQYSSEGLVVIDKPENKSSKRAGQSLLPMFVGTAIIFGLAILGMAVGAIVNNKPITGSCGGLSASTNIDGDTNCSLCHKPTVECPDQ